MLFKIKELEENISFLVFVLAFMILSFIHTIIKYKNMNANEQVDKENAVPKVLYQKNVRINFVSRTYQELRSNHEPQQQHEESLPTTSHQSNHQDSKIFLENQKNSFIKSVLNYCVKYNSAVLIVGGLAESCNFLFLNNFVEFENKK